MIQFSRFTASEPARLTKAYRLNGDGALVKEPGGALVLGAVETVTVANLAGLEERLSGLAQNQAVAWGVCGHERANVVTKATMAKIVAEYGPGPCTTDTDGLPVITRTRDFFRWPSPAIMMLDYDPEDEPLTPNAFREALISACPALVGAPMLIRSSASAYLYDLTTGACLVGARGLRVLVLVEDGEDIPRAGAVLAERLWLAGHGRVAVSVSGALNERTLIDTTVWQPERLDFCAGAAVGAGLEQRIPKGRIYNDI